MSDTLHATAHWSALPLGLFPLLAELAIKGALVIVAAYAATAAMRSASAAARHAVWTAAMMVLVALPAVVLLAPDWRILSGPDVRRPVAVKVLREEGRQALGDFLLREDRPTGTTATATVTPKRSGFRTPAWALTRGLGALWAAGVLLIALRYAFGTAGVRRWARYARPLNGRRWTAALAGAQDAIGPVRVPELLEVPAAGVPLVWGVRRPVIFLPATARDWDDERRTLVLTHELAHLRRRDVLVEALVQAACALYWYHPAVWLAARRLRLERERACDDTVVRAGAQPSAYARHLLAIAEGSTPLAPPAIVAMCAARLDDFEARMASLLAHHDARSPAAPRLVAALGITGVALLALVGPLATRRPPRGGGTPADASMVFVRGAGGTELRYVGTEGEARRVIDSLRTAR